MRRHDDASGAPVEFVEFAQPFRQRQVETDLFKSLALGGGGEIDIGRFGATAG